MLAGGLAGRLSLRWRVAGGLTRWLLLQKRVAGGLAACLLVAACTGPVHTQDNTPAGVIEDIADAPKRAASQAEQAAVLKAVASLPGASGAQFSVLQVQDGTAPVRAFCGVVNGAGARAGLTEAAQPGVLDGLASLRGQGAGQPANVTGMLKAVDGKVLAFDFRFGDFAAQRCRAMGFLL